MVDIVKPDMKDIWASGGAKIKPSASKIQEGWTPEIPPHQWENWSQNRQDEAIAYLLQKGIPEWDNTTEYQGNRSFVQYNGIIYKAKITNVNKQPDTNTTEWSNIIADAISSLPRVGIATFAEVVAISEDIGPILVTGMGGDIWEWIDTPYFNGYRSHHCGKWMDGWTVNPKPFQILATGGVWSETDEKEKRVIAHYREQGLTVTSGNWIVGQNMIADLGSGNWKAPDLRDMFKRMSGTDADTANARNLGNYQNYAIEKMTGNFAMNFTHEGAIFGSAAGVFSLSGDQQTAVAATASGNMRHRGVLFDSSRQVNSSVETRAESAAVAPYIHV